MALLIRWLVPFIAVLLAAYFFPNQIGVTDLGSAAVFAFILAILNAVVRPILQFFALPLTCITLGLFHFVINAAMFGLAAYFAAYFVPGIMVGGFLGAFLGALVVSVVGLLLSLFLPDSRR
jgi:putative membrane protein